MGILDNTLPIVIHKARAFAIDSKKELEPRVGSENPLSADKVHECNLGGMFH